MAGIAIALFVRLSVPKGDLRNLRQFKGKFSVRAELS
jgi:hypothetical protein